MPEVLHISGTPNPRAKKFHLDVLISDGEPLSFPNADSASAHPAANALFQLEHIVNVFILDQVVTISLDDADEWDIIEPEISMILEEFTEPAEAKVATEIDQAIPFPEDFFALDIDSQFKHVNLILDVKVRPGLAGDGGGLELMGIENQIVYIYYLGACGSCPSATTGTLNYIQQTLKQHAHPLIKVELS